MNMSEYTGVHIGDIIGSIDYTIDYKLWAAVLYVGLHILNTPPQDGSSIGDSNLGSVFQKRCSWKWFGQHVC